MAKRDIRVGDIGTVFEVTLVDDDLVVNVSSASVQQIFFIDPDGTERAHTSSFSTNGTDGKIRYSSQSGDIYRAGQWQIRAKVVIAAGTFNSEHKNFVVRPN